MVQLITISDFNSLRALSSNLNASKKLDPYILEAQQFDLKPLLGNSFYLAICNDFVNGEFTEYVDLFNGSEWTESGLTYRHEGLKSVLVYFSYARYVIESPLSETANGVVIKTEQYSQSAEDKSLIRRRDTAYSGAQAYWADVKKFLNDNYLDYPLWENCDKQVNKSRISAVSNEPKRKRRWH